MSNTRVFAYGWLFSSCVLVVLSWFGRDQPGVAGAAWRAIINLHVGVTAIAVFGDRTPTPPKQGR